jgi:hypothetical protein
MSEFVFVQVLENDVLFNRSSNGIAIQSRRAVSARTIQIDAQARLCLYIIWRQKADQLSFLHASNAHIVVSLQLELVYVLVLLLK